MYHNPSHDNFKPSTQEINLSSSKQSEPGINQDIIVDKHDQKISSFTSKSCEILTIKSSRYDKGDWIFNQLMGINLTNVALLVTIIVITSRVQSDLNRQEQQNTLSNQNVIDMKNQVDNILIIRNSIQNLFQNIQSRFIGLNDSVSFIESNLIDRNLINLTNYQIQFTNNITNIMTNQKQLLNNQTSFFQAITQINSQIDNVSKRNATMITSTRVDNDIAGPRLLNTLQFSLVKRKLVTILINIGCDSVVTNAGISFTPSISPTTITTFSPPSGTLGILFPRINVWVNTMAYFEECLPVNNYQVALAVAGTTNGDNIVQCQHDIKIMLLDIDC